MNYECILIIIFIKFISNFIEASVCTIFFLGISQSCRRKDIIMYQIYLVHNVYKVMAAQTKKVRKFSEKKIILKPLYVWFWYSDNIYKPKTINKLLAFNVLLNVNGTNYITSSLDKKYFTMREHTSPIVCFFGYNIISWRIYYL